MTPDIQPQRFESYRPRRLSALGQGYSLFVRVLKITLPLVALVIIGLLVARLSDTPVTQVVATKAEEKTTPGQIEVVAPKYEGMDSQQRPYTITADKAVRDMNSAERVMLEKPMGDILLEDNAWLAVKADRGALDNTAGIFNLQDNVMIYHDSGNELILQDVIIHLKDKAAETNNAVTVQSPIGNLRASNMRVTDQGNMIYFGGPAVMTLYVARPQGKS